jgi:hypothetical protein
MTEMEKGEVVGGEVLGYATFERGGARRVVAGLVLMFWAVVDLVSGPLLMLAGAASIRLHPREGILVGILGLVMAGFGLLVFLYSGVAMYCAVRVLRRSQGAMEEARVFTWSAELMCWGAFVMLLVLEGARGRMFRTLETAAVWAGISMGFLLIPLAVSFTRKMLERGRAVQ